MMRRVHIQRLRTDIHTKVAYFAQAPAWKTLSKHVLVLVVCSLVFWVRIRAVTACFQYVGKSFVSSSDGLKSKWGQLLQLDAF